MNELTTQRQKLELRAELFALCTTTNEADLKRAAIICKLNAQERQAVRAGLQQLSYLMDDIFLDEYRQKRIKEQSR